MRSRRRASEAVQPLSGLVSEEEQLALIRRAGALKLKIQADEATPESLRRRARELAEFIKSDDEAARLRGER